MSAYWRGEQDTTVSMRKKDISMMQGEGKTPEFAYPIAQCRAEKNFTKLYTEMNNFISGIVKFIKE